MDDLTTRIVAEIDDREIRLVFLASATGTLRGIDRETADALEDIRRQYRDTLRGLRGIISAHYPDPAEPTVCVLCEYRDGSWPCDTVRIVATALDVTP